MGSSLATLRSALTTSSDDCSGSRSETIATCGAAVRAMQRAPASDPRSR